VQRARHAARLEGAALLVSLCCTLFVSCVDDVDLGEFQGQARAGAPSGGGAGEAGAGAAGAPALCEPKSCFGKIYSCGDCIDNDGDGAVDDDDSQCLGPCDGTEDSYFGGIPGANNAPCRQDCYFDADTGPGNDDCSWSHRCDELSVPDDYPPSGDTQCAYDAEDSSCEELNSAQSETCLETCLPYVPNGCDCFGCCELPSGSGSYAWLGSNRDGAGSCSEETLGDPSACRPCTPVPSCFNACDPCELCAGRKEPDESCGAPGENACGDDYQACGRVGQSACPPGTYCITGCCITIPK
jgi:hypothetical protein